MTTTRYRVAVNGKYAATVKTFATRAEAEKSRKWFERTRPGCAYSVVAVRKPA
jgi:hypothetical protein